MWQALTVMADVLGASLAALTLGLQAYNAGFPQGIHWASQRSCGLGAKDFMSHI